jgi:hypothetical protein
MTSLVWFVFVFVLPVGFIEDDVGATFQVGALGLQKIDQTT